MGWFWKDTVQSKASKNSTDPFHRLDPEVREFLLRESPLKPSTPTNSDSTPTTLNSKPQPEQTSIPSKYGDRYADIWEQYQSTASQDAQKPAQEQLTDIIKAYKWRKGAIGRAALENCANEQFALHDCYRHGSFKERMTTCSAHTKTLNECYVSQAKFLRALGYMSDFSRDPEVDERIQMHADKLYQEQVKQDEEASRKPPKSTPSNLSSLPEEKTTS